MYNQPGTKSINIEPLWYKNTKKYEQPSLQKSVSQIISSLASYFISWMVIIWLINRNVHKGYIILTATITALFLVRIFIIFHDCTHNSFFKSRKANRFWGYITGLLTLTPYEKWQHSHNIHHNTYADLDHRGVGDIWTLTVKEYLNSPFSVKFLYWCYRNPLIMLTVGPVYVFLIDHRIISKDSGKKARFSVIFNNSALLIFACTLIFLKISLIYFWIYLYLMVVAGAFGIWLFYIQHQFEGVYWSRHTDWDPIEGVFKGSSYYNLPKFFQWLTANIGLHSIHHLRSHIPNYNLQKCYDNTPELKSIKKISVRASLSSLWLNLWYENENRLVSFHFVRKHKNWFSVKNK